MPRYEYKVVPAPAKGLKGKGIKGPEARFSNALEDLMNGLSGEGWEYQRAETLPSQERAGLTGTTTEWRNLLVFRRLREDDAAVYAPELLPPPVVPVVAPSTPQEAAPDALAETAKASPEPEQVAAKEDLPVASDESPAIEDTPEPEAPKKDPLFATLKAVRSAAKSDS